MLLCGLILCSAVERPPDTESGRRAGGLICPSPHVSEGDLLGMHAAIKAASVPVGKISIRQSQRVVDAEKSNPVAGTTALSSHHCNGDASQVDREPRTQLGAANHQDNPFCVSQPRDAHSSQDGTTGSDRNIVAG